MPEVHLPIGRALLAELCSALLRILPSKRWPAQLVMVNGRALSRAQCLLLQGRATACCHPLLVHELVQSTELFIFLGIALIVVYRSGSD